MLRALIQRFLIAREKQTNVSGFTLIELLVSLIIASIIVGTLLGFLVNILERDRTEQAKSESQEEIQSALNFIADDVTEAVYIYDSDGLYQFGSDSLNVFSQLPHNFNTGSGCKATNCTPVLVFWKVFRYDRDDLVKGGNSGTKNRAVRCLDEPINIDTPPIPPALPTPANCSGGNKYTYSLVAYYLLKDTNTNWSSASRIVRWEIKDGIKWSCQDNSTAAQTDGTKCPIAATQRITVNGTDYAVAPDPGFRRFDLSGSGTLAQRMNTWRANTANYNLTINSFDELIDYVDDTPFSATQDNGSGNPPAGARVNINIIKNTLGSLSVTANPLIPSSNAACDDPDRGVGSGLTAAELLSPTRSVFAQRIPPDFAYTTANPNGLSSFYACVNASRVSAKVFIRSNSLARLKDNIANRPVSDAVFDSFLPTSNVRVFGRGILSVDQ